MSTEQITESVAVAPRPQVSITQCQTFLKEGKTRKEIAEYYGIPVSVMAEKVWQHPALKGLKTKKIYDLELVDDRGIAENAVVAENSVADMVEVVSEELAQSPGPIVEEVTTEANVAFADLQGDLNAPEVEVAEENSTTQDWN